jgi:hypothetical protein
MIVPGDEAIPRWCARICVGAVAFGSACNGVALPQIEITNVPAFGSFDNLGGRVLNAAPADYRVAVFIYVPSAGWWSKPFCNPQLTLIQSNASWTADITTGGSDQYATRITALLVSTNYSEPCVEGAAVLPGNVTAQALASATVERFDPLVGRVRFSDYDWWIKSSPGQVGPGPNYFSDSTNNVWVDALGQLHLRITNRSNQWQCAEIVSQRTFGYGSYRFELAFNVNSLNLNAVLGLFTWSDDPAYAHREIDVECSRWGNAADANNSQFVVQPWDIAGHLVRYAVPAGQTNSTHSFTWATNRIAFQSQRGTYSPAPVPSDVISNWTYQLTVPQSGDENVRLNLWLINGNPPAGNVEVEAVIKSFQFVPPGAPKPPVLTNASHLPAGSFRCSLVGEIDRRYELQGTTNLLTWTVLSTVLATNSVIEFVDSNAGDVRFFRAVALP